MAIVLNATTNGFTGAGGAGSNVTVAHTVTTGATLLIVAIAFDDSGQNSHQTDGVTWNGTTMTQIIKADSGAGNEFRTELWGILNPASGTHNVVVSYGFINYVGVGVMDFSGTDSSALPSITNSTTNLTGSAPTLALTPTVDNSWIIDVIVSQSVESVGAGQTLAWQNQNQSFQNGASSTKGPISPAASTNMTWSNTSGGLAYAAAVIAPPAGATNLTISVSDSSTVTDVLTQILLKNNISVHETSAIFDTFATTSTVYETMKTSPSTGTLSGVPTASWIADSANDGGYLELTAAANNQSGEIDYTGTLPVNFEVFVDAYWSSAGADGQWLYFGATAQVASEDNANSGYVVAYDEWEQQLQVIFNTTLIGSVSYAASNFADGNWHRLHITIIGQRFILAIDNAIQMDFTDTTTRTLGGNHYGWAARTGGANDEHRMRNFLIAPLVGPMEVDNIAVTDASTVTDSSTVTLISNILNINVSDSSTVTDTITVTPSPNISVTDSSTVTDFGPFYYDDTVIVSESIATSGGSSVGFNDPSTATDVVFMQMNAGPVSVFDTSTATDVPTVNFVLPISVFDASTATDVPAVIASATPQGLFDASIVTDSVTMLMPLPVSISDSSTVTDVPVVYVYYPITVADASTATDAVVQVLETMNLSDLYDQANPIDFVMINEPEGPVLVADATTVTDAITNLNTTWNQIVFDTSTATDVPTVRTNVNPVVSDTSTATDVPTVTTTDNYLLIDSSTVTDVPTMRTDENPVVFDVTTATDAPHVVVTYAINVYEQSTVTEFNYEFITILYLSVLDQSIVTENIVFEPGYSKNAPLYYDIGDGLSMMLGPQKAAYWGNFGRPTTPVIGQWGINTDAGVVEVFQGDYWFTLGAEAPLTMPVLLESGSYSMAYTDGVILANATSGNIVITLPNAHGGIGREYTIKKTDGTSHTVTLSPLNGQTIDGATNQIITTAYTSLTIVSDGSNWFIV